MCECASQACSFRLLTKTCRSSGGQSGIISIRILSVIKIRRGIFSVMAPLVESSCSVGIFAKTSSGCDSLSSVRNLRFQYVMVETGIWCSRHHSLQVWPLAWNACRRSVQRISFSSFFMMIQFFQVLRRVYQKKIEDNRYGWLPTYKSFLISYYISFQKSNTLFRHEYTKKTPPAGHCNHPGDASKNNDIT